MEDMSLAEVNIALAVLLYGGFPVFVEDTGKGRFTITVSTADGDEVICRNVDAVIDLLVKEREPRRYNS